MKTLIYNTMKRTLCICMAWLGLGLAVQAQTCRLTTPATSIAQGRGAMLDVTLANEVEISGGQFTVTLPQGITIKDVTLNAERSTNHTLEYRLEGGNSAKILFYAQPTAPLKDNGGTLCTLALEAASDVAGGEYKVAFSEVRLAVDATTAAEVNTVEGTLKVISCYTIMVEATEGGSAAGGGVFVEGDMVTLTATPDEGYHFVRWSDGNTTNPYTFVAEADVDLTAEFAPNVYRIVYMLDGEVYKTESYAYGSAVTAIAAPVKEGYTFGGWSGVPATMPAKDVTVVGSFVTNGYTLTYVVDGEVYKTLVYEYGSTIVAEPIPTKEGYTFSGWSNLPATMPANDVTVSGSFTINKYLVTFKIGDAVVASESLEYGTAIVAPEAPEKEGHTFNGWGKVAETVPAHDVTYEGSYSVNSYTLTYMVDGEKYWEGTVAYGTALTALEAPTKEGHTFSGWSDLPATMPANDVTVNGSFTIERYTVTFYDWDGTVLKVETVAWGQAATPPADPTREGYTFIGWDFDYTNVVWDLAVHAEYVKNAETVYTVEYHAGANGWIEGADWYNQTEKIVVYTSPLYRAQGDKVTKLRITVNRTKGDTKYFCLSELELYDANGNRIALSASNVTSNADHNALNPSAPDGGGFAALFDGQTSTYFHSAWKNMPTEDHYLEITLPSGGYDAFSFKMLSRARTIENGYVYDQSHTFPGVMVMSTSVELVAGETPEPEPEPKPELDNDAVYYVSQPYNGGTSWTIATGGSAMTINTKLGITADGSDARQQFAFITNDGGKTHYLYHPAEKKYVNKDNTLSATPRDPVYFLVGEYENTFVVYFDESHIINTNNDDGLIINRWGPLSGWGKADGGNSCLITRVEKSEPEPEPEPNPQPELDNETLYFVSQPYRGATSWAIAKGGTALQCNGELGIAADMNDTRQQFAFISNDGGKTHYLYHPAERKYVNMDGSLSATPRDPVYFMPGAYENTFIVYFDIYHFINVNENPMVVINQWGPADNGWRGTADGGNSCLFTAVGRFDVTDIDFLHGEDFRDVRKVFENGEVFILLPDGSKYTMTGVKVK